MKKIIELIKKVFGLAKTVTPEQKQEIQEIAENVVTALDEVKRKRGASPAALAPEVGPAEVAEPVKKAAAKKKKHYYKPKAKKEA